MESKRLVWIGMIVGSTLGGLLPSIWGAGTFSMSSLVLSAVGAVIGIWIAFKISRGY